MANKKNNTRENKEKKAVIKENKKVKEEKEVIEEKDIEVVDEVEKPSKEEKNYASFWQRLCAFLIDVFLISMVTSLVTQPFVHSENLQKLSDEAYATIEEYTQQKIDMNTYVNRTADISYDMARENGLSSIIGIAISILYFVVYQFKTNGQTLGKKLMKIKIVKKDNSELSINDILFRTFIVNFILYDIVAVCFAIFASKDVYFYGIGIFEFIQYGVLFISSLMILSKKNKQGVQDLIARTEVIKA